MAQKDVNMGFSNLGTSPKESEELLEKSYTQEEPPQSQRPELLQFYISRLNKARDERSVNRKEFDGMTFEMDYERNREALFSYLRPKKNDDDVRVNSGTAEKKIELMANEIMAMNFQPEVRSFNQNNVELVDLGADLTDMVKETNTQENDDDVYEDIVYDLLSQRVAYLEECLTTDVAGGYMTINQKDSPTQKRGIKRRLSPLQVYPSDMTIPSKRFNEQPYIIVYERMLFDEAKVLYGKLENWKYVKAGSGMHDDYVPWYRYRFSTLQDEEVEVLTYYSSAQHGDHKQVIINSVMMYDENNPMPVKNGYTIKASSVKNIPEFFYGKPPLASAKFLQSLQDETLRNLIRKMRQAIEPPIGVVKKGKVPTRDMWEPAAVTQGMDKNNFSRLIDHDGVTQSEFNMLQLITQKTEEFIGQSSINTPPGEGKMTATQIIELQKQALKMMGGVVIALMRLKRDVTFARLTTILDEYTKPLSESVTDGKVRKKMRGFEIMNGLTATGETVKKYIAFIEKKLSEDQMKTVRGEEKRLSDLYGKDVRISYLDITAMNSIPLLFKVEVSTQQRETTNLDRILFQDRLSQAVQVSQITGRRINPEKLIKDFDVAWKSKDLFEDVPTANSELGGIMEKMTAMDAELGATPQGSEMRKNLNPIIAAQP